MMDYIQTYGNAKTFFLVKEAKGMNLWATLGTVLFLAALATIIKYFGGENLIAGYNTSSPAEKKYMAEKGIGAFVGNYIYLLALIILGGYLLTAAGLVWGLELGWGLFTVVIIIMLIRVQRFAPPPELAETGKSKGQKTITAAVVIISVIIAAGAIGNIFLASRPPQYTFTGNAMQISGAYGINVSYSAIDTVRLEPKLPTIGYKNNGLDMGPILKGHFQVDKLGRSLLFLRSADGPVIIVTFKDKREPLLINMAEPDQTRQLYRELKDRLD